MIPEQKELNAPVIKRLMERFLSSDNRRAKLAKLETTFQLCPKTINSDNIKYISNFLGFDKAKKNWKEGKMINLIQKATESWFLMDISLIAQDKLSLEEIEKWKNFTEKGIMIRELFAIFLIMVNKLGITEQNIGNILTICDHMNINESFLPMEMIGIFIGKGFFVPGENLGIINERELKYFLDVLYTEIELINKSRRSMKTSEFLALCKLILTIEGMNEIPLQYPTENKNQNGKMLILNMRKLSNSKISIETDKEFLYHEKKKPIGDMYQVTLYGEKLGRGKIVCNMANQEYFPSDIEISNLDANIQLRKDDFVLQTKNGEVNIVPDDINKLVTDILNRNDVTDLAGLRKKNMNRNLDKLPRSLQKLYRAIVIPGDEGAEFTTCPFHFEKKINLQCMLCIFPLHTRGIVNFLFTEEGGQELLIEEWGGTKSVQCSHNAYPLFCTICNMNVIREMRLSERIWEELFEKGPDNECILHSTHYCNGLECLTIYAYVIATIFVLINKGKIRFDTEDFKIESINQIPANISGYFEMKFKEGGLIKTDNMIFEQYKLLKEKGALVNENELLQYVVSSKNIETTEQKNDWERFITKRKEILYQMGYPPYVVENQINKLLNKDSITSNEKNDYIKDTAENMDIFKSNMENIEIKGPVTSTPGFENVKDGLYTKYRENKESNDSSRDSIESGFSYDTKFPRHEPMDISELDDKQFYKDPFHNASYFSTDGTVIFEGKVENIDTFKEIDEGWSILYESIKKNKEIRNVSKFSISNSKKVSFQNMRKDDIENTESFSSCIEENDVSDAKRNYLNMNTPKSGYNLQTMPKRNITSQLEEEKFGVRKKDSYKTNPDISNIYVYKNQNVDNDRVSHFMNSKYGTQNRDYNFQNTTNFSQDFQDNQSRFNINSEANDIYLNSDTKDDSNITTKQRNQRFEDHEHSYKEAIIFVDKKYQEEIKELVIPDYINRSMYIDFKTSIKQYYNIKELLDDVETFWGLCNEDVTQCCGKKCEKVDYQSIRKMICAVKDIIKRESGLYYRGRDSNEFGNPNKFNDRNLNGHSNNRSNDRNFYGHHKDSSNDRNFNGHSNDRSNDRNFYGHHNESSIDRNSNGHSNNRSNDRNFYGHHNESSNDKNSNGHPNDRPNDRNSNGYPNDRQNDRHPNVFLGNDQSNTRSDSSFNNSSRRDQSFLNTSKMENYIPPGETLISKFPLTFSEKDISVKNDHYQRINQLNIEAAESTLDKSILMYKFLENVTLFKNRVVEFSQRNLVGLIMDRLMGSSVISGINDMLEDMYHEDTHIERYHCFYVYKYLENCFCKPLLSSETITGLIDAQDKRMSTFAYIQKIKPFAEIWAKAILRMQKCDYVDMKSVTAMKENLLKDKIMKKIPIYMLSTLQGLYGPGLKTVNINSLLNKLQELEYIIDIRQTTRKKPDNREINQVSTNDDLTDEYLGPEDLYPETKTADVNRLSAELANVPNGTCFRCGGDHFRTSPECIYRLYILGQGPCTKCKFGMHPAEVCQNIKRNKITSQINKSYRTRDKTEDRSMEYNKERKDKYRPRDRIDERSGEYSKDRKDKFQERYRPRDKSDERQIEYNTEKKNNTQEIVRTKRMNEKKVDFHEDKKSMTEKLIDDKNKKTPRQVNVIDSYDSDSEQEFEEEYRVEMGGEIEEMLNGHVAIIDEQIDYRE